MPSFLLALGGNLELLDLRSNLIISLSHSNLDYNLTILETFACLDGSCITDTIARGNALNRY